jgi:DNA-directed RNA polymerase specialized sigma24 family protein
MLSNFFQEHLDWARDRVRKWGGKPNDIDDIVAEAFARFSKYHGNIKYGDWNKYFNRVLRNATVDKYSRVTSGNVRVKIDQPVYVNDRDVAPPDGGFDKVEWLGVVDSLECKIDRHILGEVVNGKSQKEVADEMGRPIRYVCNRMLRIRKLLLKDMNN